MQHLPVPMPAAGMGSRYTHGRVPAKSSEVSLPAGLVWWVRPEVAPLGQAEVWTAPLTPLGKKPPLVTGFGFR